MRGVNERWVCKRCFADNDASAGECARCGLARGSEVSDADRQAWASAAGVPDPMGKQQPAWRRWLRFWWIPVIAIVLVVGYLTSARRDDEGSVTSRGTVPIEDLRPGDCFTVGDETEISQVDGIPCDESHPYEVFAIADYNVETYPATDDQLELAFQSVCTGPFESYVGTPYPDSALFAWFITPTEEGWEDGDHEFICYLFEEDESDMSESMRDSGR